MKEQELKELLKSLTWEEKVGQLIQLSGDFFDTDALKVGPEGELGITKEMVSLCGSVLNVVGAEKVKKIQDTYLKKSRHKIPLLFMADIVYGHRTIYPIPLGLASSYNPKMVEKCCRHIAREASSAGVHVTFSPMVDVVKDARWGRCLESPGEDPWLNSEFAKAMVKGFQGELKKGESIASCVKHYAGYGAPEAGREYNTVDMSTRRFMEEYLPPYQAAIDAGCEMVMTSFNTVDEIPATGNEWLMKDILRDTFGFQGVLITDYAAIFELIAHGVAEDEKEASYLAMKATVDIDMKTSCYANQLLPLMKEGKISEEAVDAAVYRVLMLKNKLGLFEDQYRGASKEREEELLCCKENRDLARKAGAQSVVLLKNEDSILPLPKDKKIALVGPYADNQSLLGLWAIHGRMEDVVTIYQGMKEVLPEENLLCEKGCDMLDDYSLMGDFGAMGAAMMPKPLTKEETMIQEEKALQAVKESDVAVVVLGEHMMQSGEGGSRTEIGLPDVQLRFLHKIREQKKPVVLVVMAGRPLVLTGAKQEADAIIYGWFPGTEGGHAIADVLFGEVNPSGRLTMSFPNHLGQVPIYYRQFQTGRPVGGSNHTGRFLSRYIDCPNEPLYPFGYGLSYHTCTYGSLNLSSDTLTKDGVIIAEIKVKNISHISGMETVQFYIRDVTGSVVRPVKELKGFEKIFLEPEEEKTVTFEITEEMLRFYTKDMKYQSEPGKFIAMAGANSKEVQTAEFSLSE